MCWLRLLRPSLSLPMLRFQGLCSMNGLFCYVLFHSAASFFRKLSCHSSRFLPAMFGVEVSGLFALPLQLGGLGICNPVSLAFSHLFDSSICGTEHLVRSIVGLEILNSWLITYRQHKHNLILFHALHGKVYNLVATRTFHG